MSNVGAGEVNIRIESQPSSKLPENIALVSNQSYYFLRLKRKKTEDATDVNEILKDGNIAAVTACKSSSECGNGCCLARHFHYIIAEPFGDEILTIRGYDYEPGLWDVAAKFTRGRQVLGSIKFCVKDNSYQVCNASDEEIFIIRGPSKCSHVICPCLMLGSRKCFKIFQPDGKQIGEIGNKWDDTSVVPVDSNNQFGVSCPDEFGSNSSSTNWLLLGSALTLRWLFWRPCNNSLWCLVYILICVLLLAALIVLIYYFTST